MARDWHDIAAAISRSTNSPFYVTRACLVSGGDINLTYRLEGTDGSRYFALQPVPHTQPRQSFRG
jgi:hypothetical protein